MNRNSTIRASILLGIVLVGFFVLHHTNTLSQYPGPGGYPPPPDSHPSPPGIVYANAGLNTSDWQQYWSEENGFGFRVRGPWELSRIGCAVNKYAPCKDFIYSLTSDTSGIGLTGLVITTIFKNNGSTLDTWLNDYVVLGRDRILNVQKTTVAGYPALRFDTKEQMSDKDGITFKFDDGVSSGEGIAGFVGSSSRYFVIDLGNRYALVSQTLSIDKQAVSKAYNYPDGVPNNLFQEEVDALPSDQALADAYAAILDSFQTFTMTKPQSQN